jgi:hypothetical protein
MRGVPEGSTETLICTGPFVRAIGWLSPDHATSAGLIEPTTEMKLTQCIARWRRSQIELWWPFYRGLLTCPFCEEVVGPDYLRYGFVGIPSDSILYVLPAMTIHFIGAHQYLPPASFLGAVQSTSLPGTEEYRMATEPFRIVAIRKKFPLYDEWKTRYPTFLGVKRCLDLLLSSDLPSGAVEYLTWEIYCHAQVCSSELIEGYQNINNMWVKRVLIRLMSETCLVAARRLFQQETASTDEGIRFYAQTGKQSIESCSTDAI